MAAAQIVAQRGINTVAVGGTVQAFEGIGRFDPCERGISRLSSGRASNASKITQVVGSFRR